MKFNIIGSRKGLWLRQTLETGARELLSNVMLSKLRKQRVQANRGLVFSCIDTKTKREKYELFKVKIDSMSSTNAM